MAETPPKRLRQEPHASETHVDYFDESNSNSKRQKPYNYNTNTILSFLDEDEENEDHNQDLSAIFTALQQELSSTTAAGCPPLTAEDQKSREEEEEGVLSVMRHLLEASDDELGIPNHADQGNNNHLQQTKSDDDNISLNFFDNGLWEFEDVAANYYAVLQSELFM